MKHTKKKYAYQKLLPALAVAAFLCQWNPVYAQSRNHIKSTTILTEGVTTANQADALPLPDRNIEMSYLDGFARPFQVVNQQASPAGYDMVQVTEYDERGRKYKSYLPYVSNTNNGSYQANWMTAQASFYQAGGDQIANSAYPYSESRFEKAPLNRVLEQGAPGQEWQLGNHSINSYFETNTSGEVIHWEVSVDGELIDAGAYPTGTLIVNVISNESGYQTRAYVNAEGTTILKKTEGANGEWLETYYVYDDFGRLRFVLPPMAVAAFNGEITGTCGPEETLTTNSILTSYQGKSYQMSPGAGIKLTYNAQESFRFSYSNGCFYMRRQEESNQQTAQSHQPEGNCYSAKRLSYDTLLTAFQNRSYIVEQGKELTLSAPQSGELVLNSNTLSCFYARSENSGTGHAIAIHRYAYHYTYDAQGQLVAKKMPGSDWQYFVYDTWGRLVLSQDANQQAKSPREWTYTKYDAFNRPVITGLYRDAQNRSREAMQQAANDAANLRYEQRNSSIHNYTLNRSFPADVQASDVLTVNWYDDYNFNTASHTFTPELGHTAYNGQVKRLVTGTKTKVLGASASWLTTVSYYDDRYRTIQTIADHNAGGSDRLSNRYSFDGKTMESYLSHQNLAAAGGTQEVRITNLYEYDHAGRPLKNTQQINGGQEVLLVQNNYNELGEPIEKNLHSQDNGNSFLQSVDYRYNIHGWMTHINNADLSNDGVYNDDDNDLFGMQLNYTQVSSELEGTPQFNGNIAEIQWQDAWHQRKRGYGFQYDAFKRLGQAHYADYSNGSSTWGAHVGDFDLSGIQYDKNGNILQLQRKGYRADQAFGMMDQLSYSYEGNQLQAVTDAAAVQGYKDFQDRGATSGTDYSYDANGNLLSDANKGILQIDYNHLNQPYRIDFGGGNEIHYCYDAEGNKLQKTVKENGQPDKNTWYIGGMVYNDNGLELIHTDEGRAVPNGSGSFRYEYHYKDHLANTRLAFSDLDNNNVVDINEIIQVEHYYPFGMRFYGLGTPQVGPQHKYKYNGKEFQDAFGLDWYDYGARFYDPALGRWHAMDPHADRYSEYTPYNYVYSNPMNGIDEDGRDGIVIVFPDYKVDTETRLGKLPLGHGGVLLINNETGYTKYYEFGRYATTDGTKGRVRTIRIPNAVIGEDGKPTSESLKRILSAISRRAGQGGRIQGSYIRSDDFDAMNDYARKKLKESNPQYKEYDKERAPYTLTGNNCGTFACDVVKQDPIARKLSPYILIPTPDNIAEEYQEEFDKIDYDPKTGTIKHTVNKKYFKKYLDMLKKQQKKKKEEEKKKRDD